MGILDTLSELFQPMPQMTDPVFGTLTWHARKEPERSTWEGSWVHPTVGRELTISLPGPREGPLPESRAFMLQFKDAARLDEVIALARPSIEQMFQEWTGRTLADDLGRDLTFVAFDLQDPRMTPVKWELAFEVLGEKMVLICVPMIGDAPQVAYVDT